MSPTLSVSIPVHNGADYLGEALESLLAQTDGDFEILLAENASTDGTMEVAQRFAKLDRRIRIEPADRFLVQQENVSRAVTLAHGEWVKLLCHDDLLASNAIAAIRASLAEHPSPRVGLLTHGEQRLFANGVIEPVPPSVTAAEVWNGRDAIGLDFAGRLPFPIPSVTTATVRRQAFAGAGPFDNRFLNFDTFYWSRFLMNWDVLVLPQILTTNRIHGAQVAVHGRRSLRQFFENNTYWAEFLREFGDSLAPPTSSVARLKLRGTSALGTNLAIGVLTGHSVKISELARELPPWVLAVLPLAVTRALVREARRLRTLSKRVPIRDVYGG